MFAGRCLDERERRHLLSGKPTYGSAEWSPIVCACFGVNAAEIRATVSSGRAASVEDIGRSLRAGSNCGSCVPELRRLLRAETGGEALA